MSENNLIVRTHALKDVQNTHTFTHTHTHTHTHAHSHTHTHLKAAVLVRLVLKGPAEGLKVNHGLDRGEHGIGKHARGLMRDKGVLLVNGLEKLLPINGVKKV